MFTCKEIGVSGFAVEGLKNAVSGIQDICRRFKLQDFNHLGGCGFGSSPIFFGHDMP